MSDRIEIHSTVLYEARQEAHDELKLRRGIRRSCTVAWARRPNLRFRNIELFTLHALHVFSLTLSMTIRSRNALHALRLVLNREPLFSSRPFSYIAPTADSGSSVTFPTFSSSSFSSIASRHGTPASSSTAPPNFLEEENSLEYEDIRDELDDWYPMPSPHPWPTIFASNDTAQDRPTGLYCDALHNLVLRNDISAAKSILEEFKRLGYAPKPREVYLRPALACLYDTQKPDLEGFMSFLSLYPARTARTSPEMKPEVWLPIIAHIKFHHTRNVEFMARFLALTSRLGLFPNVYKALAEHLTLVVPPETSVQMFWDTVDSYSSWASHAGSTPEVHAKRQRVVDAQVSERWGELIYELIRVGYKADARSLLVRGKEMGYTWRGSEEVFAAEEQESGEHGEIKAHDRTLPFARRLRLALTTRITPNDLAMLLGDYQREFIARPALYERFRRNFRRINLVEGDEERPPRVRFRMWLQAELLLLRGSGQHDLAVRKFMSHHPWIGIPDHFSGDKKVPMAEPVYPNIHLITTILPSLCALLLQRKSSIKDFHTEYLALAKDLPPVLQPTDVTHAVWVQLSSLESGTRGAFKALNRIYAAGMRPGSQAYLYVVSTLAHKGDLKAMETLLGRLQAEAKHMGEKLPKLSDRDLEKVREVLKRRLEKEQHVGVKSSDEGQKRRGTGMEGAANALEDGRSQVIQAQI